MVKRISKRILNRVFVLLLLVSQGMLAQVTFENTTPLSDRVSVTRSNKTTSVAVQTTKEAIPLSRYKPDPSKVVWMGAVLPGYGQILNRKYWKLPLVYGGFAGCAYALIWNSTMYNKYRTAYRDIIDTDPTTNTYVDALPKGYTVETFGGISYYTSALKTVQDSYRRSRDLSILGSAVFYSLTLVDAYVDAQLFDFDISPDISLRLNPVLTPVSSTQFGSLGVQCKINIK